MLKYFIISFLVAISVISTSLTPKAVAQDGGFSEITDQNETTTGNPSTNWLWLLPLLVVPLFFFMRKDAGYKRDSMAGRKGGRATRDYDDRI